MRNEQSGKGLPKGRRCDNTSYSQDETRCGENIASSTKQEEQEQRRGKWIVRGAKTWDMVCFQAREVTSKCGFQKRIRDVHYHSIAVNADQTEVVGASGAGFRE